MGFDRPIEGFSDFDVLFMVVLEGMAASSTLFQLVCVKNGRSSEVSVLARPEPPFEIIMRGRGVVPVEDVAGFELLDLFEEVSDSHNLLPSP